MNRHTTSGLVDPGDGLDKDFARPQGLKIGLCSPATVNPITNDLHPTVAARTLFTRSIGQLANITELTRKTSDIPHWPSDVTTTPDESRISGLITDPRSVNRRSTIAQKSHADAKHGIKLFTLLSAAKVRRSCANTDVTVNICESGRSPPTQNLRIGRDLIDGRDYWS
jgi:hypothetical protein